MTGDAPPGSQTKDAFDAATPADALQNSTVELGDAPPGSQASAGRPLPKALAAEPRMPASRSAEMQRGVREVLTARARALAREDADDGDAASAGGLDVVEFLLAGERFGVPTENIREVYPLKDLTPVPCTPSFVLGIVNVRGQILTVLDLRTFFELRPAGLTDMNKLLILEGPDATGQQIRIGILADAILGARSIPPAHVQPPLPTHTGLRAEYLRGITNDGSAILDAARILADDKLVVHEEVGVSKVS